MVMTKKSIYGVLVLLPTFCKNFAHLKEFFRKLLTIYSFSSFSSIRLCGFPPFYNEHLPVLFEAIMKADYDYPEDYWDEISDTAKNFIDRLLVVRPDKRMTTTQALAHPWLAGQAPTKKLKVNNKLAGYVDKYREASRVGLS